ncbi:hypothetical protein HYDPIDRAFT_179330 [Hydnomerulius pinastri MD-312]|nr:hypothetical protein HYDPIDRAFT_179330 [Hydnomerulius pinastri MD-312]
MSFFFRQIPTVQANFAIKSFTGAGGEDTILVGQDIWDSLCFSEESKIAVSIKSKRPYPTSWESDSVRSLTCWAARDPNVVEIAIPSTWLSRYPEIFQPFQVGLDDGVKPVTIAVAGQISLTEVVLTAKTQDAYTVASTHGSTLESWFVDSSAIIRDGEDISLPSSVFSMNGNALLEHSPVTLYSYKVNLILPYPQGVVERGLTRFIVTSPGEMVVAAESVMELEDESPSGQDSSDSLEISESFLMSTTLSPPSRLSEGDEKVHSLGGSLSLKALRAPIDRDLDEVTLYIRTNDLRPLGMLNGDWVIAQNIESSTSRLVRICALDKSSLDPHQAMLSPALLHNLCPAGHQQITIHASPFGARSPALPTARSITLARVASPFAINRRYEALFTDALQLYFGSSKRLVKDGDIIPLCINVDRALDPHQSVATGSLSIASTSQYSADALVYFIVRNVEHERSKSGAQHPRTAGHQSAPLDVGCFVDATVTSIMQVGVEQTGIPDLSQYYELRRLAPMPSSTAAGSEGSDQISQLSKALSLEESSSFDVRASVLITGARGTGKFSIAAQIAQYLRMHLVEINCFDIVSDNNVKSEGSLRARVESAISCAPCVLVVRHIDALNRSTQNPEPGKEPTMLGALQECINNAVMTSGHQCVVVATMSESGKAPEGISFINEKEIKAPNEGERAYLLSRQLQEQGAALASDVSLAILAVQTAALVASNLADLVTQTRVYSMKSNVCIDGMASQANLSARLFEATLSKARTVFAQNIGAPSIPTVLWDDIGGLAHVKHEILDTVQLPLDHPELFQDGLKKRSGVLLYGPPGTGKTLLAKAVATSCSLNFFSVKGPELLNMYIGESEANVRKVFQRARDAKPCVIFFDELDSVAPKRGNQGDSGGVMDRIVSQLLAELDGMSMGGGGVFVIGATNRPDLLDPALLRPGRFDRMLYLGVSETHDAQLDILQALTRKFKLHPQLDLASIAAYCPFNYTGADFYALCADAMLHALSRKVDELEEQRAQLNTHPEFYQHQLSPQSFIAEVAKESDLQLTVFLEDFLLALEELIPSISESELAHYASIQQNWHH